jgi:hypothetical protein
MCEGFWDARTRRWVSLEELEERDQETPLLEGVAIPTVLLAEPRCRPAMLLR